MVGCNLGASCRSSMSIPGAPCHFLVFIYFGLGLSCYPWTGHLYGNQALWYLPLSMVFSLESSGDRSLAGYPTGVCHIQMGPIWIFRVKFWLPAGGIFVEGCRTIEDKPVSTCLWKLLLDEVVSKRGCFTQQIQFVQVIMMIDQGILGCSLTSIFEKVKMSLTWP